MKKFMTILLLAGSFWSFSQQRKIDSLRNLLLVPEEDSFTVMKYVAMADQYSYKPDPDSVIFYAEKGVNLSKKINWLWGEGIMLYSLARGYISKGNYPKAFIEIVSARKIFEELNRIPNVIDCLHQTSYIYYFYEDYGRALDYAKQSYELSKTIKDEIRLLSAFEDLGDSFNMLNQPDSALSYFLEFYNVARRSLRNSANLLPWSFVYLGQAYYRLGNHEIALSYINKTLQSSLAKYDPYLQWNAFFFLSQLFDKTGQRDSSLIYAHKSLTAAINSKYQSFILDAYKLLANLYADNEDKLAIKYYKLHTSLRDSLFSKQRKNEMSNLTYTEQERLRLQAVALQVAAQERKHSLQYAAIFLGLMVFLTLFLMLSNTIIVNGKIIELLGVLILLIVFEFINLFLHPYVGNLSNHSPLWMLVIMVCIAAFLVPLHHYLEKWALLKLVEKNNKVRLTAAKKIIASLEGKESGHTAAP